MAERDKNGRFIHTGETTSDYFFGKNGHRSIWEKENGPIPKGYVIHHINGDKFDNRIENLEMMTFTRHNNIHKHRSWSEGLTISTSDKLKEMIAKAVRTRTRNYIDIDCRIVYELRLCGLESQEITDVTGLCKRMIPHMLKKYLTKYGLEDPLDVIKKTEMRNIRDLRADKCTWEEIGNIFGKSKENIRRKYEGLCRRYNGEKL